MLKIKLRFLLILLYVSLFHGGIYASVNNICVDTFPQHYLLIDSIGYDYEHNLKVFNTCKLELKDPYWPWWDRTALYQSYFHSAVSLFIPLNEIKTIWLRGFENDPLYTCRDIKSDYERVDKLTKPESLPMPMYCVLLREREFFERHCSQINKSIDKALLQAFKTAEKANENSRIGRVLFEQTIEKLGVYPGRSYLGIDAEALPWFIMKREDVNFIIKYLPYMENAVKNEELHPMFLAHAIDMIAVLEKRPQIYGTQFEMLNGEKKYHPIIDPNNINKRRRSVGLGIFGKNYDIYDTVIIGKQFRE